MDELYLNAPEEIITYPQFHENIIKYIYHPKPLRRTLLTLEKKGELEQICKTTYCDCDEGDGECYECGGILLLEKLFKHGSVDDICFKVVLKYSEVTPSVIYYIQKSGTTQQYIECLNKIDNFEEFQFINGIFYELYKNIFIDVDEIIKHLIDNLKIDVNTRYYANYNYHPKNTLLEDFCGMENTRNFVHKKIDIIKFLIENGANVNIGKSYFYLFNKIKNYDINYSITALRLFIDNGYDINKHREWDDGGYYTTKEFVLYQKNFDKDGTFLKLLDGIKVTKTVYINKSCDICYDVYDNNQCILNGCGHSLCKDCIEMLETKNCPNCRKSFSEYFNVVYN